MFRVSVPKDILYYPFLAEHVEIPTRFLSSCFERVSLTTFAGDRAHDPTCFNLV